MLAISIWHRSGELKDTGHNLLRNGEFVVNIADRSLLEALHSSSAHYPPDESEAEALGLPLAASSVVKTPRIASAPASMECRLHTS
ncbi:flavin reductase family protein, partial [Rhizobiaceae sp. 2RAB30]